MRKFALMMALGLLLCLPLQADQQVTTEDYTLKVDILAEGLEHPWSLVFLPQGEVLISERAGRLRLYRDGQLLDTAIRGLPEISVGGQGGLLDLALHPNFASNAWLYFSYVAEVEGGYTTRLARARYQNRQLHDLEVLYTALPASGTRRHFGGRLVFDRQGYLYMTVGDRGEKERAQDTGDAAGSVVRLTDEGQVPADNPLVGQEAALPEIYAWGTRNAQGLALDSQTGEIWMQEHGPRGGDEVNRLQSGANYGWPKTTFGRAYTGFEITPHTHLPGIEPPLWHWTPSIAPSGLVVYRGELFSRWQGDLLVGALKARLITRLPLEREGDTWQINREERFFEDIKARIRALYEAPDASVWVLADAEDGYLLRLTPGD
ncbi:PQQ-dependent sugar dehydrogenase [Marinospirillum perlucidum]|uniref:PQQ-dependent sugar dehydrogenase n=1 Tax=Marinospirillum perlucidum TaxID=1982602 RepID=UPI000DF12311|nr:PQQ-dependent sugar dehydrogenase [Marinospirillum perlucidum]